MNLWRMSADELRRTLSELGEQLIASEAEGRLVDPLRPLVDRGDESAWTDLRQEGWRPD
jgi:hypothetical protein